MSEPKPPNWEIDLISAVVNGNAKRMRAAVANGLPLEAPTKEGGPFTPLHYAIDRATKPAVVAVLLGAGADVNARTAGDTSPGRTPLMLAAYRGRLELVKQLLAAGAEVGLKDDNGMTAVAHATWGKTTAHENTVRALLAAGERADAEALVGAAWRGTPGMVRVLVAAGADVNEVSRWGTALILATHMDRPDTVGALLDAGADPALVVPADHLRYPGQSALGVAKANKRKKVLPLLEQAAAGKRPKATKPKAAKAPPTASIGEVWDRLEAALKVAAPDVKKSLRKGTTEAKLAKLEQNLGVTLPPDLRATLLRHDGQKDDGDGLFPEDYVDEMSGEFLLMPVAEIESDWKMWKELAEGGEFEGNTTAPDRGVRRGWWNPGWIPFATDGGGDSLCVDLAPAKGGAIGQVVHMKHDDGDRPRLARSLTELLTKLCQWYEEEN